MGCIYNCRRALRSIDCSLKSSTIDIDLSQVNHSSQATNLPVISYAEYPMMEIRYRSVNSHELAKMPCDTALSELNRPRS